MSNNTVWITGAGGLIGSHLVHAASPHARDCKVIPLTRNELDLTELAKVRERFDKDNPSLLIHCAAMSNTAECSQNSSDARRANVGVTVHLAELFANRRMVFFSTDLVFDGTKGNYSEMDNPIPLGVYAETKLQAEVAVLARPNNLLIRTSLNGGVSPSGARGFNEVMENEWKAGRSVSLFSDEYRSPIPAAITARATWELALSEATGIYHVAGTELLSRYHIGLLLAARHPELNPRIEEISLKKYTGPARPSNCTLNCSKAQRALSFSLPKFTEWLEANPNEPF